MAWSTGYSPLYVLTLADAVPLKNQYQQKKILRFLDAYLLLALSTTYFYATQATQSQSPVKVKFQQ